MSYEQIVTLTQTLTLVFFVLLFAGVVLYALWPGNREKFRRAARLPLDADDKNGTN